MSRSLLFVMLSFLGAVPALAQQAAMPLPALPYVPLWMLTPPSQPLAPRFVPPGAVPFPMPFWLWYAPPPGTVLHPAAAAKPVAAVPTQASPATPSEALPPAAAVPASAVAPAAQEETKESAHEEVKVEVREMTQTAPVPTSPEKVEAKTASPEEPATTQAEAAPATTPEFKIEAKPEIGPVPFVQAVAMPEAKAHAKTAAKPQLRHAPKAEARTKKRPAAKQVPLRQAMDKTNAAPVKQSKKARKLCWQDGRLDVCP
jgi:hypothetical protein